MSPARPAAPRDLRLAGKKSAAPGAKGVETGRGVAQLPRGGVGSASDAGAAGSLRPRLPSFSVLVLAICSLIGLVGSAPAPLAGRPRLVPSDFGVPPAFRAAVARLRANSTSGQSSVALSPNIIGGTVVPPGQLPWVALVTYYGSQFCSGSMIGRRLLLTAGHCTFYDMDLSQYRVYAGRWDLGKSTFEEGTSEFAVVRQMRHPKFDAMTFAHDIGIWELKPLDENRPVVVTLNLDNRALPPLDGREVTVAGWGVINNYRAPTQRLRQVRLPTVPISLCAETMERLDPNTPVFPRTSICAGPQEGGRDSCQGDSGGPLFSFVNGRPVQHGMTSWGVGCAMANAFGVYQRVADDDNGAWIKRVLSGYPSADRGHVNVFPKRATTAKVKPTTRRRYLMAARPTTRRG